MNKIVLLAVVLLIASPSEAFSIKKFCKHVGQGAVITAGIVGGVAQHGLLNANGSAPMYSYSGYTAPRNYMVIPSGIPNGPTYIQGF
jgi:hypothetical protein